MLSGGIAWPTMGMIWMTPRIEFTRSSTGATMPLATGARMSVTAERGRRNPEQALTTGTEDWAWAGAAMNIFASASTAHPDIHLLSKNRTFLL